MPGPWLLAFAFAAAAAAAAAVAPFSLLINAANLYFRSAHVAVVAFVAVVAVAKMAL